MKTAKAARASAENETVHVSKRNGTGLEVSYSVATVIEHGVKRHAVLFAIDKQFDVRRNGGDVIVRIRG